MVGITSYLRVVDNSGVRKTKCLSILNNGSKRCLKEGSYFMAAINKGDKKKNFFNKKICLALFITRRVSTQRAAGYSFKTNANRCILFSSKDRSIGNRFKGPITLQSRLNNDSKIFFYANTFL